MFGFLAGSSAWAQSLGIFIIRVGLGLVFMAHGYGKLLGGPSTWAWLGGNMQLVGITWLPIFWGFCAMLAEFVGGFCLVLGLGTRLASLALLCVMLMALLFHISNGDDFKVYSHPLSLAIVFAGLMVAGSGLFALEHHIKHVIEKAKNK